MSNTRSGLPPAVRTGPLVMPGAELEILRDGEWVRAVVSAVYPADQFFGAKPTPDSRETHRNFRDQGYTWRWPG